jgi:hypothetical protein
MVHDPDWLVVRLAPLVPSDEYEGFPELFSSTSNFSEKFLNSYMKSAAGLCKAQVGKDGTCGPLTNNAPTGLLG